MYLIDDLQLTEKLTEMFGRRNCQDQVKKP
jgi:hypothetical protein